jgi:Ca2+-binding EF-hand superfamily protein
MSGIAAIGGGQTNWPNLSAIQQNLFAAIDADGDGQISPNELTAFGQNLPGSLTSGISGAASTASGNTANAAATSANGGVGSSSLFSQIDSNGDGTISQDEWTAYGNKLSASNNASLLQAQEGSNGAGRAHHHHHHGGGGGGSSGASSSSQSTDPTAAFNQLDTNQDGSISAQEWAAQFGTSGAASAYSTTQSNGQSTDPLMQLVNKLIG